jgi:hypothetical protein
VGSQQRHWTVAIEVVIDRLLFVMGRIADTTRSWLWQHFLALDWIGKGFAVSATLYGTAWLLDYGPFQSLARELADLAISILAVTLTAAVIRGLWRNATRPA